MADNTNSFSNTDCRLFVKCQDEGYGQTSGPRVKNNRDNINDLVTFTMAHDSSVNSPAGIYYSGLFYSDDYRGSDCSIASTPYDHPICMQLHKALATKI